MRTACKLLFPVLAASLCWAGQAASEQGAFQSDLYYLVFLRPDPNRTKLEKADGERIQAAHMANILKMADDGILVAAGPFGDKPTTISGLFVFKTSSLEKAKEIAALDPTVVEHRNTVDVHSWNGPKGMGVEYFRLHKENPATPDNMQIHPFAMVYSAGGGELAGKVLEEHMQFMKGLLAEKKLGAAGKTEEDALVGVLIFNAMPVAEAEALMAKDPAVKAGVFRVEMHSWWSADHVLPW